VGQPHDRSAAAANAAMMNQMTQMSRCRARPQMEPQHTWQQEINSSLRA
jgi:hypothetical protein